MIREWNDSELLANQPCEVDNTGTIANEDRFENYCRIERERREAIAAQGFKKKRKTNGWRRINGPLQYFVLSVT